MKAMVYYGTKNVLVEEIDEPKVQPGTVKVKVKYAGICGTDLHEYHAQRAVTKTPMILGHEFTGQIVEIGTGVSTCKVGDRVVIEPIWGCNECISCREGSYNTCENLQSYGLLHPGGFAEYVVVKADNVFLLPDNLSYEVATLVEPTAVAMQAVKSSALRIGDKVAVFGAGPIGLLVTQCVKAAGASQIIVVEIEEKRQQLALEMGADYVINPTKEDVVTKIRELTIDGVDIAFDVAGVEATFRAGLDSIRPKGELMIVSIFTKPVSFSPVIQERGEKKIHASRGFKNIFPKVIALLQKGSIHVEPIITSTISLDDIVELGFKELISGKGHAKILVSPEK